MENQPKCEGCSKPLRYADMIPFSLRMKWHPECWQKHWQKTWDEADALDKLDRD